MMHRRLKSGRSVVGVALLVVGVMVSTVAGVGQTAGAGAPASSLSVSESTQATGFSSGQTIQLGFQVTNTGNTFVDDVAVTDTLSVPISCQQTILAPSGVTTCNGSYTASTADVTAGSINDNATVTGTDTSDSAVSAQTPTTLTVNATPSPTTPLLPTPVSSTSASTPDLTLSVTGPCSPFNAVDAYEFGSGFGPTDPEPGLDSGNPVYDQWGNPRGPAKYLSYGGTPWVQNGYGCDATASLNGTASPIASNPTQQPGCNTNLMQAACAGTATNDWALNGESSAGSTTCGASSSSPTTSEPGTLCLGASNDPSIQSQPVVAIGVPTSNVSMSVGCEFNNEPPSKKFTRSDGSAKGKSNQNANNTSGTEGPPLDGNTTVCTVQAVTSTDGTNWSPLGNPIWLASNNDSVPIGSGTGQVGNLIIPLGQAEQYVALKYSYGLQDSVLGDGEGLLDRPTDSLSTQQGNDNVGLIGSNFCIDDVVEVDPTPGTGYDACGYAGPSTQATYGPAVGVTPALQINVEPTAEVQTNAIVSRIVYQPPGSGSSQTYSESTTNGVETDVSLGQSSSDVSGSDNSLENSISASAGFGDWASVNMSSATTWDANSNFTTSSSDTTGTGSNVQSTYSQQLTAAARKTTGPDEPPWMNDLFLLMVNPQFGVWDFASCANGEAATSSGDSTSCPGSDVTGTTGATPLSYAGTVPVTVGALLNCAEGDETPPTILTGDTAALTQQECDSIIAQDPFAGTALGLIPTPSGQDPGQGVDPGTVLGDAPSVPPNLTVNSSSQGLSYTKTIGESDTNTTTSTMQSVVTNSETNTDAISVSAGVKFPLFSGSLSDTLTYGNTNTTGQTLSETYSGTSTYSQSQSFTASTTLTDPNNTISVAPYWDPRFDSFMFQEGGPVTSPPTVTGTQTTALTVKSSLPADSTVTSVAVDSTALPITAGQQLQLPSGQVIIASQNTAVGSTTLDVQPVTLSSALNSGWKLSLIGGVTISGSGFDSGPAQVSFCTNPSSPGASDCSTDSSPYSPPLSGGQTLYATGPPEPDGTKVYVEVQTEAGAWSQPAVATAPSADGDSSSTAPDIYTYTTTLPVTTISPATLPGMTVGQSYSQTLTATGGGTPLFTVSAGALPPGMTLTPAGLLSGTPTTAGNSSFTVSATDQNGFAGTQAYQVLVEASGASPISLTPTSLPTSNLAEHYNQTISATGGTGPYTYAVTAGELPTGFSLEASGVVYGVSNEPESSQFTLTATDSTGQSGTAQYLLAVVSGGVVVSPTSSTLPPVTEDQSYSQTFTFSGGTAPYTYEISGPTPTGLELTADGPDAVTMSGPVEQSGTFSFTITAFDYHLNSGSQAYTLDVSPPPTITIAPGELAKDPVIGVPYAVQLTASGGTAPYLFGLYPGEGSLPAGFTLSPEGLLSGTATPADSPYVDSFEVMVTDANGFPGYAGYNVVAVRPKIKLRPTTLPDPSVGVAYSKTLVGTGGLAPYTLKIAKGKLPHGLKLSAGGVLAGTPTKSGAATVTIRAVDANGYKGSHVYTIDVLRA